MNSYFKLILFLVIINPVNARELFIVSFQSKHIKRAERIKSLLIRNHGIPEVSILMKKQTKPCLKEKSSLLHICITENLKYKIINKRPRILKRSFSHFR